MKKEWDIRISFELEGSIEKRKRVAFGEKNPPVKCPGCILFKVVMLSDRRFNIPDTGQTFGEGNKISLPEFYSLAIFCFNNNCAFQ
jgi:hypothetical protein